MRKRIVALLALVSVAPAGLMAQEPNPRSEPQHVAVESTILALDHARVSRLGLEGLTVSTADGAVGMTRGYPAGAVRVGTRVGGRARGGEDRDHRAQRNAGRDRHH